MGDDGIRRCGIRLDARLVRTTDAPKRPFQGWRYLSVENAPRDLRVAQKHESELPVHLNTALAEIGVI